MAGLFYFQGMNSLISEYPTPRRIKDWDAADRPREKFVQQGRQALSDAELVALLLGHGYKSVSAIDLARQLLGACENDLHKLARLSLSELSAIKGIGQAKAITIAAALELGRRRKDSILRQSQPILSSKQIYETYQHLFEDLPHEEFYVVLLNRSMRPVACKRISVGGVDTASVDPRRVMYEALLAQCSAMILMHNHPSGSLVPSQADRKLTNRLVNAAKIFDIVITDHVIFTNTAYYSFSDSNESCMLAA